MSLDQIMAEAARLPQEQRKALISQLLTLGGEESEAEFCRKTTPPEGAEARSIFDRLQDLSVNDPGSPSDLATNRAHMEDFGASRSA